MFYLYSGLGAVSHSFSGNLILEENGTGEQYIFTSDARDITRFMTTTGGGAVVMLNNSLGVDFGGELGIVFVGSAKNEGEVFYGTVQYAYILDFKVALVTIF
jgi:hypothetical protein